MSEYDEKKGYEDGDVRETDSIDDHEDEFTDDQEAKFTGDTDRVRGEYHSKGGFTQKLYTDAHFSPAEETATPPKYYTPPEKPVKEPKPPKPPRERKGTGRALKVIALCLVCAILGGIGGAALVGANLGQRLTALEEAEAQVTPAPILTNDSGNGTTGDNNGVSAAYDTMLPSDIYEMACQQVVGITSEVTTTNFFGYSSSAAVSGSGFIITSDGYILTNYHVVEYAYKDESPLKVMLHDGTEYSATIIGVEEANDVAVIKIDATDLDAATLGDSNQLSVGDLVFPVGNPLGELDFSMTTGHVSALDRVITTSSGGDSINMFQMDAAVNSGNSGGPVYNDKGQVIGIVTAKYSDTGVEGLGFAIPVNDASAIANDLITLGYVAGKAYLGVVINNNYNSMYAQYYKWPEGAFVDSVESGTCAANAGIQSGDIITKLGDVEVTSFNDLKQALKQYSAGDTVEIELYRTDKSMSVSVTLDEAVPEAANSNKPDNADGYTDDYGAQMQPGAVRP